MISLSLPPRLRRVAPFLVLGSSLAIGATPTVIDERLLAPTAAVETEPVPSEGDAADDPAIWVHPDDPAKSLVLGTDKKGGLNVFNMEGRRLQVVSDGARPNNVDVLYGFPLGGRSVDLAVSGTRSRSKPGIALWRIDPERRRLAGVGPVPAFPVFDGGEPYGSCVYRSPRDAACFVFVSNKDGAIEQYRLEADAGETIRAERVRSIRVGSQVEGCVADFALGHLYVAEEDVGIWKFGAEPDAGSDRSLVARVGENGLTADVEGLTIYYASKSKGYLIASSQGSGTFAVFEREGSNAFVATIDPKAGSIPDLGETDGIDVTNVATSTRFPRGLFVAQDGRARGGRQNFKFFAWDEIAGDRLLIDTSRPVRPRRSGRPPQRLWPHRSLPGRSRSGGLVNVIKTITCKFVEGARGLSPGAGWPGRRMVRGRAATGGVPPSIGQAPVPG